MKLALPWQVVLAVLSVTALGPLLYRIAIQPVAQASVLVLLIVAVAIHFVLMGLGLLFFGAEGSRTPAFTDCACQARRCQRITRQSLWVYGVSAIAIGGPVLGLQQDLYGKSLMATAFNRIGARLVGIKPEFRRRADADGGGDAGRVFRRAHRSDHHAVYYDSGLPGSG
jgi:branched-chain amino acid transport system permease protein